MGPAGHNHDACIELVPSHDVECMLINLILCKKNLTLNNYDTVQYYYYAHITVATVSKIIVIQDMHPWTQEVLITINF